MSAAAEAFGQPLMPHQQLIADVGTEVDDNGIPYYREIVVTMPRQNGKTTLTLAFEVQRAVGWGTPQSIAHTAQNGKAAREKMLNDQAPLLTSKRSPIHHAVDRVMRGIGNESIVFKNGSRIFPLSGSDDSGHGMVIHFGTLDETFADEDDRREQALLPAMLTIPTAQILNISTAGTDKSPFLRRKVDAGRAAVSDGRTSGIAYFEWSADEGADIDDPATWYSCMPALGRTIVEANVIHARQSMSEGEFRRAMLNQWTVSEDRVIPSDVWAAACLPDVAPAGQLYFAVDVNPERTATAIAVADADGRIELVRFAPGVAWAVADLIRMAHEHDSWVVVDTYGPAGSLVADLEAAEVKVQTYQTGDVSKACARFYDDIADGKISMRSNTDLDNAAKAAARRQTGDTWLWARRNAGEDISPLIAATLAHAKAVDPTNVEIWVA